MNDDFERASTIVNGWFYTYIYNATTRSPGYDDEPFVFCVAPSTKNLNCFLGLNLHHLPTSERVQFLVMLDKYYNILKSDARVIIDEATIRQLLPSAGLALRYYNKKNVRDCHRVKNKAVGRYIEYNGNIYMAKPTDIMNKYWANYVTANTPENIKKTGG